MHYCKANGYYSSRTAINTGIISSQKSSRATQRQNFEVFSTFKKGEGDRKNPSMESFKQLKLREKMLLIELQAVRGKIHLYEGEEEILTVTNEPGVEILESKAIPEQTATGKGLSNPLMAVALPKSNTEVNCEPILLGKSQSSPEQTAPGKDSANPLRPGALVKSMKDTVNPTSLPSKEITNPVSLGKRQMSFRTTLSDSQSSDPQLKPSYISALSQSASTKQVQRFYVIYNGPHAGIYFDWSIVGRLVNGHSYLHRKFSSFPEACVSAAKYTETYGGSAIEVKGLPSPKAASSVARTRSTLLVNEEPGKGKAEVDHFTGISHDEFLTLWAKARAVTPDYLDKEFVFTDDKATKSYFNFLEGANPEFVHKAFQAGLVKNIYPSSNLQELKNFPAGVKKVIKGFRKKILKAEDSHIYVQISSSIASWHNGISYAPYYFIEVGLAKQNKEFSPSKVIPDFDCSPGKLDSLRVTTLENVIRKSLAITASTTVRVNYCTTNCVITSWQKDKLAKADAEALAFFEQSFKDNTLVVDPTTKKNFCIKVQGIFPDHLCDNCEVEMSSSEEKVSSTEGNNSSKMDPVPGIF